LDFVIAFATCSFHWSFESKIAAGKLVFMAKNLGKVNANVSLLAYLKSQFYVATNHSKTLITSKQNKVKQHQ
jgi:hypothetical protein